MTSENIESGQDGAQPNYSRNVPQYEGAIGAGPSVFPRMGENVNFSADDNGQNENQPDKNLEALLGNRMMGRGENMNDELLSSASTPLELFEGLREIEEKLESGDIPHSLTESYRPPGQLSIIYNRKKVLQVTTQQLIDRKKVIQRKDGTLIPSKRVYAGYALQVNEKLVEDEDGNIQVNPFTQEPLYKAEYEFGTPERRKELANAYERAEHEMEARAIVGEWVGVALNLRFRDSLEDLVNWEHATDAKLKSTHLTALFNMPDLNELQKNPENKLLGDQVEEALFLNLLMLNSNSKQRMQTFLNRPGSIHLITKLAKEEEARRGTLYSRDQWVKDNIGDIDGWVEDYNPAVLEFDPKTGGGDKDFYKKTRTLEKTWKYEVENGFRGTLTRWGNIAAFEGNPGDFSWQDEKAFIEKTMGGLVGSVEASWIASSICRGFGVYASEGYAAYPNGKSHLPLGEGRFISGDDRGKFYAYMFNFKEATRGRPSGLRGMIGKIPDMAFNLFDWAQVAVDDLPLKPDGTKQRRSIWDAWLGTAAGLDKIDLLTGKPSGNKTAKEDYHRLGDLNFESLDRDFHGTFGIMQWLIGREGDGVFTDALKVDLEPKDFTLHTLKKKIKYNGIVMNPIVLTKGSTQLYDYNGDETALPKAAKIIQKNYFRNLMNARIHSASFLSTILGGTISIAHPDYREEGIPLPLFISANINEALKDFPDNYLDIFDHYVDDYQELTHLGESKVPLLGITFHTSGTLSNRFDILRADLSPSDPVQKENAKYVGGNVRGWKNPTPAELELFKAKKARR